MSTDRIKNHFEEEPKEFDTIIQKLIPHYHQMIDALVTAIPFSTDADLSVVDLGCGTGTVSLAVQDRYPNATITCIDIAERMLEMAKTKLKPNITCIRADFNHFDFSDNYDLIVSSLALHHLETYKDKLNFYKKIYAALKPDGMFINIDVVLGSDAALQSAYMQKWEAFMAQTVTREEIEQKWLQNYAAEDHPAPLTTHLDMLKECGFTAVDVVYKYYNFAVYTGKK